MIAVFFFSSMHSIIKVKDKEFKLYLSQEEIQQIVKELAKNISEDLKVCADMVSELDDMMLSLNEAIQECLKREGKEI